MKDDFEIAETVVNGLSELIRRYIRQLGSESRHPGADADKSDDKIAWLRERIVCLRSVRENFEDKICQ